MKKEFHLTKAGIEKLEKELDKLRASRRHIANRLKTAREFGDLTENSEYQTARDDQVTSEARILEIKHILKNSDIIQGDKKHTVAELGSTVILKDDGHKVTYQVVGSFEADPAKNKISDESPIGKAILGKKVGEGVEITLPAGKKSYTIKSIK